MRHTPVPLTEKEGDRVAAHFADGSAAIIGRDAGKGMVWMVGGEVRFGQGHDFPPFLERLYLERGGRRWVWIEDNQEGITATPRVSDDELYVYLYNPNRAKVDSFLYGRDRRSDCSSAAA